MLSFYEHRRQTYGDQPLCDKQAEGEFMVGDYADGSGVGEGGEFAITAYRFGQHHFGTPRGSMTLKLGVHGDATGALEEFIAAGGLAFVRGSYASLEAVTAALLDLGLTDRSDYPSPLVTCAACHGAGKTPPAARSGAEDER